MEYDFVLAELQAQAVETAAVTLCELLWRGKVSGKTPAEWEKVFSQTAAAGLQLQLCLLLGKQCPVSPGHNSAAAADSQTAPRKIQFHFWLISHGCCISYSYWQRDTSDSAVLHMLPSQIGNLLFVPLAERRCPRQQQSK